MNGPISAQIMENTKVWDKNKRLKNIKKGKNKNNRLMKNKNKMIWNIFKCNNNKCSYKSNNNKSNELVSEWLNPSLS